SLMGLVQGALALAMGRVGSMGALMPIGYFVPGVVTDIARIIFGRIKMTDTERIAMTNMLASVSAALTANALVFGLWGVVLVLYLAVAGVSGLAFGLLGAELTKRLKKVIK
ncbi:MAG: hypothetical protein IJO16_00740, partial [Clostridia bacterium]|nr:hypothetical protein [Clostridia bacterium]